MQRFQYRTCLSRVSACTVSGSFKGPLGQTQTERGVPPKDSGSPPYCPLSWLVLLRRLACEVGLKQCPSWD